MLSKNYTTVIAQGSAGYRAPLAPGCPNSERYMPVHLVSGGGWTLVDRRTGRVRGGPRSSLDRYGSWTEANAAAQQLNTPPAR